MAGPEELVQAPPLRPPLRGLLQAAAVVEHPIGDINTLGGEPSHWQNGIGWRPRSNANVSVVDPCQASPSLANTLTGGELTPIARAYPFELVVAEVCSAFPSGDEFEARARETLAAKEWAALEAEFELGTIMPANPHLASTTTVPIGQNPSPNYQALAGGANLSPSDALAVLDEAIATARIGQGMIHATWFVVDKWVGSRVVEVDFDSTNDAVVGERPGNPRPGVTMLSPAGNIIVAGSGYIGADPATGSAVAAHASQYAYATGLVTVHRDATASFSPGERRQALSMTNTVVVRASRMYVVEWSRTLHAAVKVSTVLTAVA